MTAFLGAFLGAFTFNAAWMGIGLIHIRRLRTREQAQAARDAAEYGDYVVATLRGMHQTKQAANARREVMN